jgi:hypothetical protein
MEPLLIYVADTCTMLGYLVMIGYCQLKKTKRNQSKICMWDDPLHTCKKTVERKKGAFNSLVLVSS